MRYFRPLLTPVLVVVYWQLLASSGVISAYLLPPPLTVLHSAVDMWRSGELPQHIATSLARVFEGFFISCSLGMLLAGLVARFSWLEQLLSAPLALFRMIPPLAMTPLLILWLGIGEATQLSIIVLASIFPIFLNARDGLRRVSPEHSELAVALNLSPLRYLFFIVIPSAVPSTVTGVRLAFGYSWRALIGAELIAAASGLGYLIVDSQEMMRTDAVMVGILTIGLIGWLLDALFYQAMAKGLSRRFPEVIR
ncbi:Putative aliphatic sulfonates transport permease protein ssuC [Leminorella richardii]|uniref:Aliphatic sulfonates transport permease protein ssuC n=1 Tax=Leminorella richardii TaxID=158841 RepID=A0A2X4UT24_9GAMM|nr:ABC transporter permease [Leminorella richardii]SQI43006.1 Putative aliphatic sulfonates transport permease protein ssuC [Leminorella richardii]